MPARRLITQGMRFGRLTVLEEVAKRNSKRAFRCLCDCGNTTIANLGNLVTQTIRSCGCLSRESRSVIRLKHGESHPDGAPQGTPEYRTWKSIIQRCFNRRSRGYPGYGGRGITMCERWRKSFAEFLADMGRKPSPLHSIDRYPDNNGNYEPGNCRWATRTQQNRNRRDTVFITINGQTKCVSEWAQQAGISWATIQRRMDAGLVGESLLLPRYDSRVYKSDRKGVPRESRRRGSSHPSAQFTEKEVERIRNAYASGAYSLTHFARLHGVTKNTISALLRGKTWAHVAGALKTR
jgi:hypothetical protein